MASPASTPPEPMSTRLTSFAQSLRQLGEIEVTTWDFMTLLNKDIRDFEFGRSLRQIGSIKVMEIDFKSPIPAINRIANTELDFTNLFRRTSRPLALEWDFRSAKPEFTQPSPEETQALILRLKNFLEYVTVNLIDHPKHAVLKVQEIAPRVLCFTLLLVQRDVALLVGREGFTAAALRHILKAAAAEQGTHLLLRIRSHEPS